MHSKNVLIITEKFFHDPFLVCVLRESLNSHEVSSHLLPLTDFLSRTVIIIIVWSVEFIRCESL